MHLCWASWCTPDILTLQRLRWRSQEFRASLGHRESLSQKTMRADTHPVYPLESVCCLCNVKLSLTLTKADSTCRMLKPCLCSAEGDTGPCPLQREGERGDKLCHEGVGLGGRHPSPLLCLCCCWTVWNPSLQRCFSEVRTRASE